LAIIYSGVAIQSVRTFLGFFMDDSLTTQVLIDRIHRGKQGAEGDLCKRLSGRVEAAVRCSLSPRLKEKIEPCDLVQEVLIDILRYIPKHKWQSEPQFWRWISTIVENKICDEARRQKAMKRNSDREVSIDAPRSPQDSSPLELPVPHKPPTPSQGAIVSEDLDKLAQAMAKLRDYNEEYHQLLINLAIFECSCTTIGRELGIKPDAVRKKKHHAMAKLTAIFNKLNKEP